MTMAGNPIGMDTIRKLMKSVEPKSKDVMMAKAYSERWPGEADTLKLAKAVDAGAKTVTFRDGKKYRITYLKNGIVRVNPIDWYKFVPMGFFSVKTLKDAKLTNIDPDDLG